MGLLNTHGIKHFCYKNKNCITYQYYLPLATTYVSVPTLNFVASYKAIVAPLESFCTIS